MQTINKVPYYIKQISYNRAALTRSKSNFKAIVIHYTGNSSKGANAEAHYNYFNNGNRNASADVFIDDKSIWRVNDWYKYYTWAIGDGHGKYGYSNQNTISIEMCVNADGDFAKTQENAIAYIKYLHENNFTKNLIRHYDASRKLCPAMYVDLNIAGYNSAYTYFRKAIFDKKIINVDNNKKLYRVQVGAFSDKKNADDIAGKLKELGFEAIITEC
jgi:N-acetylmuramoyl-L-alanine amidase